jgi:hypothetical protein
LIRDIPLELPVHWNLLPIEMISLPINGEGTEELKPTYLKIEIA